MFNMNSQRYIIIDISSSLNNNSYDYKLSLVGKAMHIFGAYNDEYTSDGKLKGGRMIISIISKDTLFNVNEFIQDYNKLDKNFSKIIDVCNNLKCLSNKYNIIFSDNVIRRISTSNSANNSSTLVSKVVSKCVQVPQVQDLDDIISLKCLNINGQNIEPDLSTFIDMVIIYINNHYYNINDYPDKDKLIAKIYMDDIKSSKNKIDLINMINKGK